MRKWKKASEGIRYREHPKRLHGIMPDRYWCVYFRQNGKQVEQSLGWSSQGITLDIARRTLGELRMNYIQASGPATLAEKRRLKLEAEEESRRRKELEDQEKITFRAYYENHYLPVKKTSLAPITYDRENGRTKKWLLPYIGSIPLRDISQFHLERIKKTALDSGQSPRSVQYILAIFRKVWNFARQAGVVQIDSPTRAVKLPKFDNQRLRFLTHDETTRLLAALQIECDVTYRQALISLDAGLRAGEILKLTWGDIDTARETILCRDTKSGRNRTVYMSGRLVDMFSEMKRGNPDDYIFPGTDGLPLWSVSKIFKRVVRDLKLNDGIEDRRLRVVFHSLRHTHASRLIEAGTDIYLVKTLLGHRHVTTTERYAHVRAESLRDAIRRMERANQSNVIPIGRRDESTKTA